MLSNRWRISWVLLLSFIVIACAQTQFVATGKTYEPWKGTVKIFRETPKGIKYEELGWISGKMGGMVADWGAILKAMQKEAKNRGANAIILINKETSNQLFLDSSYKEKSLMVIAIRILE